MYGRALLLGFGALLLGACTTTTHVVAEQFHLPPGGDAEAGKGAFVELGCARCHEVVGHPDLPKPSVEPPIHVPLGAPSPSRPTDARLVTAIIHPDHQVTETWRKEVHGAGGSRMMAINDLMSVRQLLDLVAFLRAAKAE